MQNRNTDKDVKLKSTTASSYLFRVYLQLPNLRGHEWPSMGKSISLIGQSAVMVSLTERDHTGDDLRCSKYTTRASTA